MIPTLDPMVRSALARGAAERKAGRAASAQAWFRLALCGAPDSFNVTTLMIGGDAAAQARWCGRALCLDPIQPQILQLAGQALAELGRPVRAMAALRRAVLLDPAGSVRAGFLLAEPLSHSDRLGLAYAFAWWAAVHAPSDPAVLVRLTAIAGRAERWEATASAGLRASKLLPQVTGLSVTAVVAARQAGRQKEAWVCAKRAALFSPEADAAALLLTADGDRPVDLASAAAWARRTVALKPMSDQGWEALAQAQRIAGRAEDSLAAARRGLLLAPADLGSARAMAQAGLNLARYDLAQRAAATGRVAHPQDSELAYLLAQAEKATGDLGLGWDLDALRTGASRFHRTLGLPAKADGPDLPAQGLLLATEQGIGDELLLLSCLPDLLAEEISPVVEADARLHPLLARSFPGLSLIDRQARPEGDGVVFDYRRIVPALGLTAHLHNGDLPGRYRRDRSKPSRQGGYLKPDPAQVAAWRKRLAECEGEGPLIGLCWRSMIRSGVRSAYYADLPDLLPILRLPGYRFVCLQYDDCQEELDALRRDHGIAVWRPHDLDQLEDLDGVAALIAALDGVVSAATSVCVLAAAVGCPTIRLGHAFYSILDDRDLFFASVTPTLRRSEKMDIRLALERAAGLLARPA